MTNWALVTGAAHRIGRDIAIMLHNKGYNVLIHYANSHLAAQALCDELNKQRVNSSVIVQAELSTEQGIEQLASFAANYPVSILINNASSFYPTPLESLNFVDSQKLLTVNLLAPYFLAQKLSASLRTHQGSIINLLDIHGVKPLKNHGLYSISKAGLQMATLSLSQELGPDVRVNGIAPGAILWPENSQTSVQDSIIREIPLNKLGSTADITNTVRFLIDSHYITGQVITVDGGRTAVGYQGA